MGTVKDGSENLNLKSADASMSSDIKTPLAEVLTNDGNEASSALMSVVTGTSLNSTAGEGNHATGVKVARQLDASKANNAGQQLASSISASVESTMSAMTSNNFAASVTGMQIHCVGNGSGAVRKLGFPRRESVSGEIPIQINNARQTGYEQCEYNGHPGHFSAGDQSRYRYQHSREQLLQNGRMFYQTYPGEQDEDLNLQRGTVYASDHQYSFRCMMQSRFVGQFIGRGGVHIKHLMCKAGVSNKSSGSKIANHSSSINVEPEPIVNCTQQVVNVYGVRETCDKACYEILRFLFYMNHGYLADEDPDSVVQLQMLADDNYCGLLIGRDGHALRMLRETTCTRITFAKLLNDPRYFMLYPERVVYISGKLSNVVRAQSEITAKQHEMRLLDKEHPLNYGSRRPNISHAIHHFDTICDIIIENDMAGAIIGRRGCNIKAIMTKSQALVSVLPKVSELDDKDVKRYVRIAGSHEALFRASYSVFLFVTRATAEKISLDNLHLDSQLFVPAHCVGHIIGKRGHRIRNMEARTNVKIHVLSAPQPPPSPSGTSRSRVKITGNFWNTQAAIRELLRVVQNTEQRGGTLTTSASTPTQRQRCASLSTERELPSCNDNGSLPSSHQVNGNGIESVTRRGQNEAENLSEQVPRQPPGSTADTSRQHDEKLMVADCVGNNEAIGQLPVITVSNRNGADSIQDPEGKDGTLMRSATSEVTGVGPTSLKMLASVSTEPNSTDEAVASTISSGSAQGINSDESFLAQSVDTNLEQTSLLSLAVGQNMESSDASSEKEAQDLSGEQIGVVNPDTVTGLASSSNSSASVEDQHEAELATEKPTACGEMMTAVGPMEERRTDTATAGGDATQQLLQTSAKVEDTGIDHLSAGGDQL